MRETKQNSQEAQIWGPYANYDDVARFQYGRLLWRQPAIRARLLAHWLDERHPYSDRFQEQQALVEEVLKSDERPAALDRRLRRRGTSLRSVVREIPPVFGDFW
jgi:hypothetical protein